MTLSISDLLVKIPETDNMLDRSKEYLIEKNGVGADIIIRADLYKLERWPTLSEDDAIYMESCFQFYRALLDFNGMMLHASALEYNGRAYLFSGPCGMGKSTHTRLWQSIYGDDVQVFNDDKPALRRLEGKWFAYGTPWCGKDGINQNKKVPLGGICFLKRGETDKIRRLEPKEAMQKIIWQTTRRLADINKMNALLELVDKLVCEIPIFELECTKEPSAAYLSSEIMCKAAQEENL